MLSLRCLAKRGLGGGRGLSSLVVDSPYGTLDYPNLSIPEFVWENMDRWPDHTAVVCGVTGRGYTYAQARGMARNFAAALLESGIRPGQVISLVLPNLPEFPIILLGALEAGITVSTINPIYSAEEMSFQLKDTETKAIVTFPEKVAAVEAGSAAAFGASVPVIVVGSSDKGRPFSSMVGPRASQPPPFPSLDPSSVAILPYSSGTTGLPKGVKLSHRNIVVNNCQIAHSNIRFAYETTKDHQDITPCILPFFHIYGMTVAMLSYMRVGAKLVTLPRFEPESFIKVLKEHKNTVMHVAPPLVQFMASHPGVQKAHLESFKGMINGAASISLAEAEKLLQKKEISLVSGYGMTETSPAISSASNTCKNLATVGGPMSDTQIKIVSSENGEIIDPKKKGEICCKGPQVMIGYHNNEKATAEMIKDGWLHTGDIGYFDENNQLYIVDRLKEIIKVKGFQVAPLELEEILKRHPSIADAGVVGKDHEKHGEVPVAFVVVKPGAKQPKESEILDYVASKVVDYKRLSSVFFIPAIPKNTTGKILRKDLRAAVNKT